LSAAALDLVIGSAPSTVATPDCASPLFRLAPPARRSATSSVDRQRRRTRRGCAASSRELRDGCGGELVQTNRVDLLSHPIAHRENTALRVRRDDLEVRIALECGFRPCHFLWVACVPAFLARGQRE
jgi:hypothetical protein